MAKDADDRERKLRLKKIEYFTKQWEDLEAVFRDHWKSHDQAILTLAAAALAFSAAFFKEDGASWTIFLGLGWTSLLTAIISTLVSFRVAAKSTEWEMGCAAKRIEAAGKGQNPASDTDEAKEFRKKLDHLNMISAVSFIAGMLLIAIFAAANQKGNWFMPKSKPVEMQKGAPTLARPGFPNAADAPNTTTGAPTSTAPASHAKGNPAPTINSPTSGTPANAPASGKPKP